MSSASPSLEAPGDGRPMGPVHPPQRRAAWCWCLAGCLALSLALGALPDASTARTAAGSTAASAALRPAPAHPGSVSAPQTPLMLIGLGDSMTHGTMDGTNTALNTLHAYLQKIAEALGQVTQLTFSQPLFDAQGQRLAPFRVPTNLGVDGADAFSV